MARRRPEALAHASRYFACITGGRYTAIAVDDAGVKAVPANGGDGVPVGVLSRGAVEQLYLCVRFGMIRARATDAGMPVLLDDVLVNFDARRAEACADVIVELARSTQVVVATCHPATRDRLAARGAQVVEWDSMEAGTTSGPSSPRP